MLSIIIDAQYGWDESVLVAVCTSSYGFDLVVVPNRNLGMRDHRW